MEGAWLTFVIAAFWLTIGAIVAIYLRDRARRKRTYEQLQREKLVPPPVVDEKSETLDQLEKHYHKKG